MNSLEKLRKIYAVKGPVDLKAIQTLFDEEGFRVGLPGGIIARTLEERLAIMLRELGGETLKNEEEVAKYRNRLLMDQIKSESSKRNGSC